MGEINDLSSSTIKLLNGECQKYLGDTIKPNSIDLTVTSPPYDNLRTYNNSSVWNFKVFKEVAKKLWIVTKKGGVIVWVVGDATVKGSETGSSFRQALYFKELGFNLHDTMLYEKTSISFPDAKRYQNSFEYMFVLSKGVPKTINLIMDKKNKYAGSKIHGTRRKPSGVFYQCSGKTEIKEYGIRWNIWKISNKGNRKYNHPAVFPRQLARDHIISWSNEGDTILDCFMGCGTTGKEAKILNRNFIGIEVDKNYFKMSKANIYLQ